MLHGENAVLSSGAVGVCGLQMTVRKIALPSSGAAGVCELQTRWNPDVQRTKVVGRIKTNMKDVHDN